MLNNYELRQKLDEAGFPFDVDKNLSELIEACGVDFVALRHLVKKRGDDIEKEEGWWATSVTHGRVGESREEAVAELWLAINEK